jgi:hypothetical protein
VPTGAGLFAFGGQGETMPNTKKFSMDYRPESYWDCHQEGFTNIKGEMRRRSFESALHSGQFDFMPETLLSDNLSDAERHQMGAVHPVFMGGEYLPDYLTGELEIARASLQSVMWDVISIRARKLDGGRISYRVVDEYESNFQFQPASSAKPLTMERLISLIDSVKGHNTGCGEGCGLTDYYRDFNYQMDENLQHLNVLVQFVRVSSMYYPELEQWYEEEAQEWYLRRFTELKMKS